MTAQIADTFLYNGEKYTLIVLEGEKLITPQDYGMQPQMISTACYRGFYSTYEINNTGLFLIEMAIGEVAGGWIPIQNIMPTSEPYICHRVSSDLFWVRDRATEEAAYQMGHETQINYTTPSYKKLRVLAPFTGRIKLGKYFIQESLLEYQTDPIQKLFSFMAYQRETSYKTLLEFTFNEGKLLFIQNLSLQ